MHCPRLSELPPPPAGSAGWPWTVESDGLPDSRPDGEPWPRISVVTPSFNQAPFLEATIRSILLQGYPNLEYFVLDGGSRDGSIDILRKYAPWLTGWVSEPDGGQSAAINRGLKISSGSFFTWINSDDMLFQNALSTHARRVGFHAGALVYCGDCAYVDEHDRTMRMHRGRVHDFADLMNLGGVWRAREPRGHLVQPEVLFPRQLAIDVGGVDEANHFTMDFDLWGRLLLAGASFRYTHIPFARFRVHSQQKTGQGWAITRSLTATALKLVAQAGALPESDRRRIAAELRDYEQRYWRETGPLARARLPEGVVLSLREWYAGIRQRAARLRRSAFGTGATFS